MQIGHYKLTTLVLLILGLSFLLTLIFSWLEKHFKKFALPSIISIIGGVLIFINQVAWKWPIINPLLVDLPIIEGEYKGTVFIGHISSNKTEIIDSVNVYLKQSGTSTTLDLYSPGGSHSESILADLKQVNEIWYLYLYYTNENSKNLHNKNRYDGASKCEIQQNGNKIKITGKFFNDETRKTYGFVEFNKIK